MTISELPNVRAQLGDCHPDLAQRAIDAADRAVRFRFVISDGAPARVWDSNMARRVNDLGAAASAVFSLADSGMVSAALSQARTALEHHFVDMLVFHAQTYEDRYQLQDESIEEIRARLAQREDFVECRPVGDNEVIVRWGAGVPITKAHSDRVTYRLSPYYFELFHTAPALDKASLTEVNPWDNNHEQARQAAKREADRYYRLFRWESLCKALRQNELLSEVEIRRYRIWYKFLSRFVHAREVYYSIDRNWTDISTATEVAVLFGIGLIASELDSAYAYAASTHGLDAAPGGPDTEDLWMHVAHLWYPTADPHPFDIFHARNTREFLRESRAIGYEGGTIAPDTIPYYADPIARLRDMHLPQREIMTGLSWVPDWLATDR